MSIFIIDRIYLSIRLWLFFCRLDRILSLTHLCSFPQPIYNLRPSTPHIISHRSCLLSPIASHFEKALRHCVHYSHDTGQPRFWLFLGTLWKGKLVLIFVNGRKYSKCGLTRTNSVISLSIAGRTSADTIGHIPMSDLITALLRAVIKVLSNAVH